MNTTTDSVRWLVVFSLVAALSVGIAACGDSKDNKDSGSSSNKSSKSSDKTSKKSKTAKGTAGQTSAETSNNVSSSRSNSVVAGGRVFAANSPWNSQIDGLSVDPDSSRMLDLATERKAARETPGKDGLQTIIRKVTEGIHVNTEAWAPLIVEARGSGSEVTRFVCRQQKCSSEVLPVPDSLSIPANTTPDPRYDGWLSVIDSKAGIGYDFWRARRQSDNSISYQYAKAWTLAGPGFSNPISVDQNRAVGARGSGLPLFAGVIGAEEASQGRINHALAISVPGLARRNYVQPASVTDGNGNQNSLPAGARIRLRGNVTADDRNVNLKGVRGRSAESILVALRKYGAIVVDRAAVPTLYTPRGTSQRVIGGSELSWLTLDDFEVISLPKLYQDPPLGQVNLEGPGGTTVDETSTDATGSGQ